jgi:hypothetical protein
MKDRHDWASWIVREEDGDDPGYWKSQTISARRSIAQRAALSRSRFAQGLMNAAADPCVTIAKIQEIIDNIHLFPGLEDAFRGNLAWGLLLLEDPTIEQRIADTKRRHGIFGGAKPIGGILFMPGMPIKVQP